MIQQLTNRIVTKRLVNIYYGRLLVEKTKDVILKQWIRFNTEDRKAQILKIASDIFYRDGYERGSLNEIARRARITKAAIYHHFKNKDEILYRIIISNINRLISNLEEIDRAKGEPIKKLREMIDVHLSYNSQKTNSKIVFEDGHFLSKKHEEILRSKQRTIVEIYKNKLKEIASAADLKEVNIVTATFSILGNINWLYQWYNPKGEMSIEKIKDDIIKIIFYGTINKKHQGTRIQ